MNNKSLLLLRHAKSDRDIDVADWLRPLKKRGAHAAKTMGHWMHIQQLQPDLVISSPAKRAISTAKKVCKAMGIEKDKILQDERVYNATPEILKQVLRECPATAKRVMLVGHNPSLEMLLTDLVKQPIPMPEDDKLMPTTALAQLQLTGDWAKLAAGMADLVALTRVKSLTDE